MAQRTQPWTFSGMTLIKRHHWIHFQQNPIPMKYHFSNTATLLEQTGLLGAITLVRLGWSSADNRDCQRLGDFPSSISSWAGPDQISPARFFTYVDRTTSQVVLRTSFASLALITLPTFPPQQNKGARGCVEKNRGEGIEKTCYSVGQNLFHNEN